MRTLLPIFTLLTLALLAGCVTGVSRVTGIQTSQIAILKTELQSLNLQNPMGDMEKNLSHGDMRFIGIYGFTLYCPGVDKANYNLVGRYGIRPIHGTSDAIERGEHGDLMNSATEYARSYNRRILGTQYLIPLNSGILGTQYLIPFSSLIKSQYFS